MNWTRGLIQYFVIRFLRKRTIRPLIQPMCTLVILRRPRHPWPLIIGGNRDEMASRRSLPPGRHWPACRGILAGLDCEAGGTWMGVNDAGLVASIMNRVGTLGRLRGKSSRGELVLKVLEYEKASDAAAALVNSNTNAYRAFNLFVGDARDAYWVRYRELEELHRPEVFEVPEGLSMPVFHR